MNVYYFGVRILTEFGQIDFQIYGAPKFDDRRIFLLVRGLGSVQSVGNGSLSDPGTSRGEAVNDLGSKVFRHGARDGSRFSNCRCGEDSEPTKVYGENAVGGDACDRIPECDACESGSRIDGVDGKAMGLAIDAPLAVACYCPNESAGDCLISDLMCPDNCFLAREGHTRNRGHCNPTKILGVQGYREDYRQKKGAVSHTGT